MKKRGDEEEGRARADSGQQQSGQECRICGGEEEQVGDRLIQPCQCTGSLQLVHTSCLQRWIETRNANTSAGDDPNDSNRGNDSTNRRLHCEVCGEPYRIQLVHRISLLAKNACSTAATGHMLEAILLFACIVCVLALVARVSKYTDITSAALLWTLFVLAICLAGLALFKIFSRWALASSVLTLEEGPPPPVQGRTFPARPAHAPAAAPAPEAGDGGASARGVQLQVASQPGRPGKF